jgi:hypothetical protein
MRLLKQGRKRGTEPMPRAGGAVPRRGGARPACAHHLRGAKVWLFRMSVDGQGRLQGESMDMSTSLPWRAERFPFHGADPPQPEDEGAAGPSTLRGTRLRWVMGRLKGYIHRFRLQGECEQIYRKKHRADSSPAQPDVSGPIHRRGLTCRPARRTWPPPPTPPHKEEIPVDKPELPKGEAASRCPAAHPTAQLPAQPRPRGHVAGAPGALLLRFETKVSLCRQVAPPSGAPGALLQAIN